MDRYYFIGIGGTAMASVAAALHRTGAHVRGSDAGVYPPMSGFLDEEGVIYHASFDAAYITAACDEADAAGIPPPLFVIGNAISRGNVELEAVLTARLRHTSMAALVGERLIGRATSLVVTGTHGKTTTASLAAWVLECAGRRPGFLIGGIPVNFGEGCRAAAPGAGKPGAPQVPAEAVFVSEGDEYDTAFFDKRSKFVHYHPDIAIINNIEFDHADIFASVEEVERAFRHMAVLIPGDGLLVANGDDARARAVAADAHTQVQLFGQDERCDWRLGEVTVGANGTRFDVTCRHDAAWSGTWQVALTGAFNARNALGVIAACARLGLTPDEVRAGLESFAGVRRRMDVIGETGGITVVDDFAHHPTAIRETLAAAAARWPGRRLVALFEPRSNTTTRSIFQRELAEALSAASVVVVGAVNRADRYAEAERLSVSQLLGDLSAAGVDAMHLPDADAMVAEVRGLARPGDVIVFLSNGAFGGAHGKLMDALRG